MQHEVIGPLVLFSGTTCIRPRQSTVGSAPGVELRAKPWAALEHLANSELPQEHVSTNGPTMSVSRSWIAGITAMTIIGFAVVMVFLMLAAQYESWTLPLAEILVVPMCSAPLF